MKLNMDILNLYLEHATTELAEAKYGDYVPVTLTLEYLSRMINEALCAELKPRGLVSRSAFTQCGLKILIYKKPLEV